MAVSYSKLYKYLEEKGMTMADLRKAAEIAPNTMTRFNQNKIVSTEILCRVCAVLDTNFGDIIDCIPEQENK